MSDHVAVRWLVDREPVVPAPLRDRMHEAVWAGRTDDTVSRLLGEAAIACLHDALAAGNDRDAALHLLAADALLTHGAEAAAEAGSDALEAFAARFDAAAL